MWSPDTAVTTHTVVPHTPRSPSGLPALRVAVHTETHVTPAASPLPVQLNQVDDMQRDTGTISAPLPGCWGGGGWGGEERGVGGCGCVFVLGVVLTDLC